METEHFNCSFTIKVRPGKKFSERLERIGALAVNPSPLINAVKRAAAWSLLSEYSKRFTAKVPDMLDTVKYKDPRPKPVLEKSIRERVDDAQNDLSEAMLDGRKADIRKAQESLAKAIASLNRSVQNPPDNPLSTGKFRKRMWQVIRLLTSVNTMGAERTGTGIMVGIGPLRALDMIQTPSATEMLTDSPTESERTVLWRQLEFGTGVYAANTGKAWRYGRKGLMLRGAKGANALRLPASGVGVMNKGDAVLFEAFLETQLEELFKA